MLRSIPHRLPLRYILGARPSLPMQRCLLQARHRYSNKPPLNADEGPQTPQDQPRLHIEESAVDAAQISTKDSTVEEIGLQGAEVSANQNTEAPVNVDVDESADTSVSAAVDESFGEEDFLDSTEATHASNLDLFGPETKSQPQSSQPSNKIDPEKYNPLSAHGLDENTVDWSLWEKSENPQEQKPAGELNPEEWADTRRSVEETKDVEDHLVPGKLPETTPLH